MGMILLFPKPQGRRLKQASSNPYTDAVSQCEATVSTIVAPLVVRNALDACVGRSA